MSMAGPRELTSWKQIAAHLGVNVRTAQKWERDRGLPIRRIPGGHGRVSAEAATLDVWKHASNANVETTCFRWPVDREIIAEVRFTGTAVRATHIQRLQQYLEL